jgi:ATP-dependent RNA helicase DDX5/DBP2
LKTTSIESVVPVVQVHPTHTGETGTAYTFFTQDNNKQAKELVKILDEANQEVDPKLREIARNSFGGARRPWGQARGGGGGGYRGGGGGGRFQPYGR